MFTIFPQEENFKTKQKRDRLVDERFVIVLTRNNHTDGSRYENSYKIE
jgi:hypothetical protein